MNHQFSKILYISPFFPPLNTSRSIANAYYCMELSKLGYKVIILTAEIPKDYISYFENFQWFKGNFNLIRVDLGLYKYFYSKKNNLRQESEGKPNFKLLQLFKKLGKELFFYPDSFIYWSRRSFHKAKKLINKNEISTIITASDPYSSHILGFRLKRKFPNTKWIGIFGDPWSLDFSLGKFERVRRKWVDKKVIYHMDKYVFTTENCRDLYCNEFGINSSKTSIFSRGYDPKIYNYSIPVDLDKKKINFVYSGAIGKYRNINPFIHALNELNSELYKKVKFYFVGLMSSELKQKLKKFKFVKIIDFVSFEKAISFSNEADILLLFDNNNSIQLPAKVFEYLGTSNPILTFTINFNSPLSKLMKEINRGPLVYNRKEDILESLKEIVILYEKRKIPREWKIKSKQYEISNVVLSFAKENLNLL